MSFLLPNLPYPKNALMPFVSEETISFHYGKHHKAYVAKVNDLIENTPQAELSLEDLVRYADGELFEQAAQAWNHDFYWRSMKPGGGGQPSGALGAAITSTFGSFDSFKKRFLLEADSLFGSGWVWLVLRGGKLTVITTSNADTPLAHGEIPLFVMDLWEHAYYLDWRNSRPAYTRGFIEHLVNWNFAGENFVEAYFSESPHSQMGL
jgi:Fe-Mn family superoxide dismutase